MYTSVDCFLEELEMFAHATTRLAAIGSLLLIGCTSTEQAAPATAPHSHQHEVIDARSTTRHLIQGAPVSQLGFWLKGELDATPRWRARGVDGLWTQWSEIEVTWTEADLHVGRALMSAPAIELEFDGLTALEEASVELFEERHATDGTLTRDLPIAEVSAPKFNPYAAAPAELVIPRAQWGARNPDKVCNSPVAPYRISIHHTAEPSSDGGDPAARMRQMQAYHIDTNGWCDIGYHFVVSQSGLIYQGRSNENHPGAHVRDQNHGNVGISLIGNYQESTPEATQLEATARIMSWVKDTYDIEWSRDNVKGHREWPGQSTGCPGDNLLAKLPELMDAVESGNFEPTPGKTGVKLVAGIADGSATDLLEQGKSAGVPDALEGDAVSIELILENGSGDALRGVTLGYEIDVPYITATNYTIYTDHPAYDKTTWVINDADGAPENPSKDTLGASGELTLYALGANESKRVVIDLLAAREHTSELDAASVRAWIKNIDGQYTQETWGVEPVVSDFDELLADDAPIDVLSVDAWHFQALDKQNTEGWSPCSEASTLARSDEGGMIVLGGSSCAQAPAWTNIDADTFDTLLIKARSDQDTLLGLSWARDAQPLPEEPQTWIELPGSDEAQMFVVPLSEEPTWSGAINSLSVQSVRADGTAQPFALDAVLAQSARDESTSTPRVTYIQGPRATFSQGPTSTSPTTPGTPNTDPGAGDNSMPGEPDPNRPGETDEDGEDTRINVNSGGCQTTPSAPIPVWMLGLLAIFWRRRRTT